MANYRTTGDLSRNSSARLADEPIGPQRPLRHPPRIAAEQLRQFAHDRRRRATGLARHRKPHAPSQWLEQTITQLRQEANEFERQAAQAEGQP